MHVTRLRVASVRRLEAVELMPGPEINLIIGDPAKRIKRQGRIAHIGRQKLGGGVKRIRPLANRVTAPFQIIRAHHSAATLVSTGT